MTVDELIFELESDLVLLNEKIESLELLSLILMDKHSFESEPEINASGGNLNAVYYVSDFNNNRILINLLNDTVKAAKEILGETTTKYYKVQKPSKKEKV